MADSVPVTSFRCLCGVAEDVKAVPELCICSYMEIVTVNPVRAISRGFDALLGDCYVQCLQVWFNDGWCAARLIRWAKLLVAIISVPVNSCHGLCGATGGIAVMRLYSISADMKIVTVDSVRVISWCLDARGIDNADSVHEISVDGRFSMQARLASCGRDIAAGTHEFATTVCHDSHCLRGLHEPAGDDCNYFAVTLPSLALGTLCVFVKGVGSHIHVVVAFNATRKIWPCNTLRYYGHGGGGVVPLTSYRTRAASRRTFTWIERMAFCCPSDNCWQVLDDSAGGHALLQRGHGSGFADCVSPELSLGALRDLWQILLAACTFCVTGNVQTSGAQEGDYSRIQLLVEGLESIWQLLRPACISFGAMMLASTLRLLFFGVKLKGGDRNFDPAIRAARFVCRGASFAFLITAWQLSGAGAVNVVPSVAARDGVTFNLVDTVLEEQMASMADERTRRVEHNSTMADPPNFTRPPPEPGEAQPMEVPTEMLTAIKVLTFQRADQYIAMWVSNDTTAADAELRVSTDLYRNSLAVRIHPADPQLPDDVITMCVTPTWWEAANRVGVIFEHAANGGEPFLGVVPAVCCLTDVFVAYGASPPDGMDFFLKNATEPLLRQGNFRVTAAATIRLRPAGLQRIALPKLEEALSDLYWARDVRHAGIPTSGAEENYVLAIAPEGAKVLDVSAQPTVPQLQQILCDVFDRAPDLNMMVFSCHGVDDVSYSGVPYSRIVALMPHAWLQSASRRTGVFLDARELGEAVAFHVFSSDAVSLEDIAATLETAVPDGIELQVTGTDGPFDDGNRFRISQGSVLTVWVRNAEGSSTEEIPLSTEDSGEEADDRNPWRRPFYLPVKVFRFQSRTHHLRLSILPEDDVVSVIDELEATVLEGDNLRALCPARPQPGIPYITVLQESVWTRMLMLQPILIDLTCVSGHCFMEFFEREFCLDDVARVLGVDWDDSLFVYAWGYSHRLEPERTYEATQGMVISICGSHESRPDLRQLDDRLRNPQDWAALDLAEACTDEPLLLHHTVLLGERMLGKIIELPSLGTWVDIRDYVARQLCCDRSTLRLTTTAMPIRELAVRGRRLPNVIGVADKESALPYGIFVDARELGAGVAYIQRHECTANIREILHAAGAKCHDALKLVVAGAVSFTPQTGTVTYGHRTVLCARIEETELALLIQSGRAATGSGGDDSSCGGDGGAADDDPPARSRSPRRATDELRHEVGRLGHGNQQRSDDCGRALALVHGISTVLDGVVRAERNVIAQRMLCLLEDDGRRTEKIKSSAAFPRDNVRRPVPTPCRGPAMRGADDDGDVVNAISTPVQAISLAAAIGPPTFDVRQQCLRLMSTQNHAALAGLCRPWPEFLLSLSLEGVKLKHASASALLADTSIEPRGRGGALH